MTAAADVMMDGRYAILFAGTPDWHHLNTLELCYRTLIDRLGFDAANIFALVDNGTRDAGSGPFADGLGNLRRWPGDDTEFRIRVTGAGTAAELRKVCRRLGCGPQQLGPDDLLFIHTEGHGGFDAVTGEAFIETYRAADCEGARYAASRFAADLASIGRPHRALLVLMGQCSSGGFARQIAEQSTARTTAIACAAPEHGSSHWSPERTWNHFTLNWLQAVTRKDVAGRELVPSPEVNSDGDVCALEAWKHAAARASLVGDAPVYVTFPHGTPETPGIADGITLTVCRTWSRAAPTVVSVRVAQNAGTRDTLSAPNDARPAVAAT